MKGSAGLLARRNSALERRISEFNTHIQKSNVKKAGIALTDISNLMAKGIKCPVTMTELQGKLNNIAPKN